ncbi:VOC family protein [Saccharothrix sp. NPDC042600]|uniref:VOC family protein n=1 Tax=Saccharothrix TaxID=2071 RepID=UPI0033FF40E0|nr:hypothetical protein GCM10017745_58570 [Saccharothrix mutabilis subsp. capreolus]
MTPGSVTCTLTVHDLDDVFAAYRDVPGVTGTCGVVFVTDDCDATFGHLEAAGVEVMQEPITRTDGTRDCAFLDPSGTLLRFTGPVR